MINVTKTFLPPQEEYSKILEASWDKNWITNRGPLVRELESSLCDFLSVSNVLAVTNGTIPLQIAMKALSISGEVITTPFSYVATTSSIVWEGCRPIFVDIHPKRFTIDVGKIEEAITPNTSAILATHVYGIPCDVEEIEAIATKHGLKVIYDAAHCFGVTYKGKSVFEYGDISTCSFHATKVFHSGEGGAVFANDQEVVDRIFSYHNFGHKGKEVFSGVGINAKMSELQAAMGLAVLPYMQDIFKGRKERYEYYLESLGNAELQFIELAEETKWNYAYFPVLFKTNADMLSVKEALESEQIFPRQYFYPSLNTLDYVENQPMPISESVASRILCLPFYHDLEWNVASRICAIINNTMKS